MAAFVLVSLVFAGCTGEDEDGGTPGAETLEPGTIEGEVIDRDGLPVGDATVALLFSNETTTTDANGAFRLEEVAPGPVTLVASKPGYSSDTVRDTLQEAGRLEVGFRLLQVPSNDPTHQTLQFDGTIPCGLPAGAGCGPFVEEDLPRHHFKVENGLRAMVMELEWSSPSPPIAETMRLDATAATDEACGEMHATTQGQSALRLMMDEGFPVSGGHQCALVFPGDDLVVEQAYTLWVTLFYYETPDEGFSAIPS